MLGGCAATSASQAAAVGGPTHREADDLPAQVHPAADIRQVPDDPAEPFSPNYGPNDWPNSGVNFGANSRRFGSPFTAAEEEAIIAAAITAHEMLRP
jgi:hypothetical protein